MTATITLAELKQWRGNRRQTAVAGLLGVSIATYQAYERGRRWKDNTPLEIPVVIALAVQALKAHGM